MKDDPVLGFSPPAVVTVFHTHVWEGTIDYRFVVEFFFPHSTPFYRLCLVNLGIVEFLKCEALNH